MDAKQSEFMSKVPVLYTGVISKAFDKNCSPRAAIKAKCLTCCNFVREDIRECAVVLCPLYSFRPYQVKTEEDEIS